MPCACGSAPAPIALAIVQAVAECLAGVVYVNAIKPGHPAIFGTWPFVSDLRTGAMSGGSAEQALLSAGCAQMHRFYDLPGGAAAGMAGGGGGRTELRDGAAMLRDLEDFPLRHDLRHDG